MTILIVAERFYPKLRGGEVVVWRVAKNLAKKGHEVKVLTPRIGDTSEYETINGIEIFRPLNAIHGRSESLLEIVYKGVFGARIYLCLRNFVKKVDPDVIFNIAYTVTIPCGIVGQEYGIPVATNVGIMRATDYANSGNQSLLTRIHSWKEKLVLGFGGHEAIRVASNAVARKIESMTDADIFVIPSPIDDDLAEAARGNTGQNALRGKLEVSEDELFLLFVGGLEPVKNVGGLIEMLHGLGRPYKFLIVGDGSERKQLQVKVDQLGMSDYVSFAGAQPQQRVFELMASADALLLGSKSEVLPTVVLEALSVGTPVISTDVGGVKEIKSRNLTTVKSVKKIANEIEKGIVKHNEKSVIKKYSSDAISIKFEKMFQKVAN